MASAANEKLVMFKRTEGSCACGAVEKPIYDDWFSSRGVSAGDFDQLMTKIVEPVNTFASHQVCYIVVTTISCGAAGWCCQAHEQCAMMSAIKEAVSEFNANYPNITCSMIQGGLSFHGPAPAGAAVPVVMAREDPEEKLAKLKSMLDKGLISQTEYDTKKADLLAAM